MCPFSSATASPDKPHTTLVTFSCETGGAGRSPDCVWSVLPGCGHAWGQGLDQPPVGLSREAHTCPRLQLKRGRGEGQVFHTPRSLGPCQRRWGSRRGGGFCSVSWAQPLARAEPSRSQEKSVPIPGPDSLPSLPLSALWPVWEPRGRLCWCHRGPSGGQDGSRGGTGGLWPTPGTHPPPGLL